MLLRPTDVKGAEGKKIFRDPMTAFDARRWTDLLAEAAAEGREQLAVGPRGADTDERRSEAAEKKIRRGELSRARLLLDPRTFWVTACRP